MNENNAPAGNAAGAESHPPAHPVTCFFHIFFKAAAVVVYFLPWVPFVDPGYSVLFTILLLLFVFDFWTVKNVSGRLLVGLRWWNDVSEEGDGWRFESLYEGQREINRQDKFWFWTALVVHPIIWAVLGFFSLVGFKIHWTLVCLIALVLGLSNLYGYYQCSREAKKMLKYYAGQAGQQAMQQAIHSSLQSAMDRV